MHPVADFHHVAFTRVRLNIYGKEAELEPGNIMGWAVSNITFIGGLEGIL